VPFQAKHTKRISRPPIPVTTWRADGTGGHVAPCPHSWEVTGRDFVTVASQT